MIAGSKPAIYRAIAANEAIAVTKFVVTGITGSSAMLSEGIHSSVDTFNGVLLVVGLRPSQRRATPEHRFGHGKELYFWGLIVAVLIFGLGGGVSMSHSLSHTAVEGERLSRALSSTAIDTPTARLSRLGRPVLSLINDSRAG